MPRVCLIDGLAGMLNPQLPQLAATLNVPVPSHVADAPLLPTREHAAAHIAFVDAICQALATRHGLQARRGPHAVIIQTITLTGDTCLAQVHAALDTLAPALSGYLTYDHLADDGTRLGTYQAQFIDGQHVNTPINRND